MSEWTSEQREALEQMKAAGNRLGAAAKACYLSAVPKGEDWMELRDAQLAWGAAVAAAEAQASLPWPSASNEDAAKAIMTPERMEEMAIAATAAGAKDLEAGLLAGAEAMRERERLRDELEEKLWSIIDRDGPGGLPSDIVDAVSRLVQAMRERDEMRERLRAVDEARAKLAEWARQVSSRQDVPRRVRDAGSMLYQSNQHRFGRQQPKEAARE